MVGRVSGEPQMWLAPFILNFRFWILDCGSQPDPDIMNDRRLFMDRRTLLFALVSVLLIIAPSGQAQQTKSTPRIGFLSRDLHPADSRAPSYPPVEAFREGLRQKGYVEGQNIHIEYRYAEARFERLPALAEELIRLKVDVIVVDNAASARVAKKLTNIIPIVVATSGDPIGSGLVASLAAPGGNVTGLTSLTVELLGKRLELLKEAVPKASRIAFLEDDTGQVRGSRAMLPQAQAAAQVLGVKLQLVEVRSPNPDIDGAFRVMVKERVGALITSPGGSLSLSLHRKKILELVQRTRMPALHSNLSFFEDGGLMYYGANTPDLYRRAATYVDKILRGAKPADLPVEQPMKFDLGINLKAAKQIGLTIPPNVLARANRVIK